MQIRTNFDVGDFVREVEKLPPRKPIAGYITQIIISGGNLSSKRVTVMYRVRANDGRTRTLAAYEMRRAPTVDGQPVPR